jgi:hypothetical protein
MLHGYLILIVGHLVGQVNPLKPEAFAATIFFAVSHFNIQMIAVMKLR